MAESGLVRIVLEASKFSFEREKDRDRESQREREREKERERTNLPQSEMYNKFPGFRRGSIQ